VAFGFLYLAELCFSVDYWVSGKVVLREKKLFVELICPAENARKSAVVLFHLINSEKSYAPQRTQRTQRKKSIEETFELFKKNFTQSSQRKKKKK